MATKKSDSKNDTSGVAIGAGVLAGAAAIAAGYYFYASKDAKKHRQIVVKWANDLKGDVVREAKKLKKIDKASIMKIIDQVSEVYHTGRNIEKGDVMRAVKELKNNWKELFLELQSGEITSQKVKGKVKAVVKKVSKKK